MAMIMTPEPLLAALQKICSEKAPSDLGEAVARLAAEGVAATPIEVKQALQDLVFLKRHPALQRLKK